MSIDEETKVGSSYLVLFQVWWIHSILWNPRRILPKPRTLSMADWIQIMLWSFLQKRTILCASGHLISLLVQTHIEEGFSKSMLHTYREPASHQQRTLSRTTPRALTPFGCGSIWMRTSRRATPSLWKVPVLRNAGESSGLSGQWIFFPKYRGLLYSAQNTFKKDPGRARQNSLATAGTNFTKPGAQNIGDLCIY